MLTRTRIDALRRLALVLQVAGFVLVAGVIWLDEAIDLPHLLFRASPTPFRPEEALFEMLLLGLTAAASILVTGTILRRLAYVETLVRFCPSRQRVLRRGEWTSVSDFFQDEEAEALHYGVCPDCAARATAGR